MTPSETPSGCVAVAYSGGRDSLALLHATCRAAQALGLRVVALHVHHGLQPEADAWQHQARQLTARWRRRGWPVSLQTCRLSGQPGPGDSVEAWARRGRHEALARMAAAAGASLLLLAQHRRDQAETVLLQLLRGGGPAGLAAMPAQAQREGLVWARPWLGQPRRAIDGYVQRHRLQPVEDPSNADPRWARNRLRLQLWSALEAAFPDAEVALALAARRAAEADAALAELAAIDLAACAAVPCRLALAPWRALSPARRANALRAWWQRHSGRGLPETLLQRLLLDLPSAQAARWPPVDGLQAVCYRGHLRLQPVGAAAQADTDNPAADRAVPAVSEHAPATALDLSCGGLWPLPGWAGALQVTPCTQGGVAVGLMRAVCCRPRQGGERFQRTPGAPPRSLKKQFQALGVPEDARSVPLLWHGQQLLFVPGLGVDARAIAPLGTPQCGLRWLPGQGLAG